jgi:hypothetical protein
MLPLSKEFPKTRCDIVSVLNLGQCFELFLAFSSAPTEFTGVFLQLDIFSQRYRELEWIKRPAQAGRASDLNLSEWAGNAARNRRMRQQQVGPYGVNPKDTRNWTPLCCEQSTTEPEEAIDTDRAAWSNILRNYEKSTNGSLPSRVSLNSLYPDVTMISNRAVCTHTPVYSLKSRSVPVELNFI